MNIECEECGLEIGKNFLEVIDGIATKIICTKCFDPLNHIIIKKEKNKEENLDSVSIERINNKEYLKDLRRYLKMERIKMGCSIEELSEKLKINKKELEEFERGLREDMYIRKKLMDFFGIKTIDWKNFKNKESSINFKSNKKLHELIEWK